MPTNKPKWEEMKWEDKINMMAKETGMSGVEREYVRQKEGFVEMIKSEYDCAGPTDEIHRCSYGHCKNCGKCDLISDIIKKIEEHESS